MWNKIYLAVLAAAIVTMGILLYFPYSWTQSVTAPRDVETYYKYYSNISWVFLLASSSILLILGNVLLWTTRRAWAMWTTLLFFAVFVIAQTFWLDREFFDYQQRNNLTDNVIWFGAFTGIILIALAAVIVFFDQYIVKRLLDKTYPPLQPVESSPEEISANEKNI